MRITVLGSGSAGNATLVQADGVCVLVDAGFSGKDLERRLLEVAVEPASLSAIVITHEHGDHTRGMGVLARRFGVPLYLTPITRAACARLLNGSEDVHAYASTEPLRIGPLEVQPFLTVHDAADPVAVTVRDVVTGEKLGIATDLGRPTAAVRQALSGCDVLVLEANHDEAMLWNGPYPWSVKQRIASSHGHLSNRASGELARELHHRDLLHVILAHLSEHCNDGALAADVVGAALDRLGYAGGLVVAPQERPLEPVDVATLRRRTAPAQLNLL
ncbi:MAG TPA: MBL fold metallo-hydrolase [Longimicrobiales bacterium]|nr:MBL fold metallo-hydrolase [Longimicrobiales bacterium]